MDKNQNNAKETGIVHTLKIKQKELMRTCKEFDVPAFSVMFFRPSLLNKTKGEYAYQMIAPAETASDENLGQVKKFNDYLGITLDFDREAYKSHITSADGQNDLVSEMLGEEDDSEE
jgi:hypothetical protein